jgi:hypothetical protein
MRLILIAIVVAAVVWLLSVTGAAAEPAVTLDRTSGVASDAFVFSGSGFEPGSVLRAKYTTPAGKEYGFTAGYGEATFVADGDGKWSLSFTPAQSPYNDGAIGEWKFTFCRSNDASVCYSQSFNVTGGATGGGGAPGDGGGY